MINDGSSDNSLSVCYELKGERENVVVVSQENKGVSRTRNLGMSLAQGKYILFLDSDDYLSNNAVKDLVAFFDAHYEEIDLVTYPIFYVYNEEIRMHFRYEKYFSRGTTVYDLNETPYVIQATVNVVVKNGLGIRFDEAKTYAEDEKFCTECIMQKYKLGYVEEAIYYYRKTSISAASTKTNPLFQFDDTINYYEYLFDKYRQNGRVAEYVQCLYLNNFRWRFNSKEILPTYLDDEGYREAYSRLMHIIAQLDVKTIMETPFMPKGQQAVLLKLKNHDFEYEIAKGGKVNLIVDETAYPFSNLHVNLLRSKIVGNQLKILGLLDQVCLADMDFKFSIAVECADGSVKKKKPKLKLSQHSLYLQNDLIIPKYIFDTKINVKDVIGISFNMAAGKNKRPARLRFHRYASDVISGEKYDISYSEEQRKLIVQKLGEEKQTKLSKLLSKLKKEIWLYNDRDGVFDNAYYQFLHDCRKIDRVERYYIYNDNFDDIAKKFKWVNKKHLVRFKSERHEELFMKASKIITSFADGAVYCPLGDRFQELRGSLNYELVYLQHGILYANLRKMYTKENTEIDKFVVSSDFEIKNLTENYNYNPNDLISSGMPRLRKRKNAGKQAAVKRKILFAPSWRANLTGPLVDGKRVLDIPNFLASEFYKGTQQFLNSKALTELLEKNDLTLDFKLHPNFKGYEDLFIFESDRISIGFGNIDLGEYKLFITDFSSFQFDFINLSRPILYFIPDITEFRAGLHSYNKLELSTDELFGPRSYDVDEAVKNISEIIDNEFQVSPPYLDRMNKFFNISNDPCEVIYRAIK